MAALVSGDGPMAVFAPPQTGHRTAVVATGFCGALDYSALEFFGVERFDHRPLFLRSAFYVPAVLPDSMRLAGAGGGASVGDLRSRHFFGDRAGAVEPGGS